MILAVDLGGTKLALAVFTDAGELRMEERIPIDHRSGDEVGNLICQHISEVLRERHISSIGICVPGIYHNKHGKVWAPNIKGWDNYPLRHKVEQITGGIPVSIDSDRACYILGEAWKGSAQGCDDAIYLSVGTGIGAGIMTGGQILRGAHDIAGAIGWLALERPFRDEFISSGCFEGMASGAGIARQARKFAAEDDDYQGTLNREDISAHDVFDAYDKDDRIARQVISTAIELWGMAIANLVSLFDTEKVILGGGVFGPAARFIPDIRKEAEKWAQPVSMKIVKIEASSLEDKAGLYGAGLLAVRNRKI
ncbi:MAG TPA: ROK family protein [Chitinophagaceae bacterium]|nr:ROK family protein [Chitinophagaceae bacterium]